MKQVKLTVDNDLLRLHHENSGDDIKNEEYTRREFNYSNFERSFVIPDNVDREKISAACENGVLRVVLPFKEEKIKRGPKEIDIK